MIKFLKRKSSRRRRVERVKHRQVQLKIIKQNSITPNLFLKKRSEALRKTIALSSTIRKNRIYTHEYNESLKKLNALVSKKLLTRNNNNAIISLHLKNSSFSPLKLAQSEICKARKEARREFFKRTSGVGIGHFNARFTPLSKVRCK